MQVPLGVQIEFFRSLLDRALRAEAAADRSLRRATDGLERLQRRRKGEPVPRP